MKQFVFLLVTFSIIAATSAASTDLDLSKVLGLLKPVLSGLLGSGSGGILGIILAVVLAIVALVLPVVLNLLSGL